MQSSNSRAARERLRPRGKPYWRGLDQGLHVGYRRLKGASGRWAVRFYAGDQSYVTETIATADDLSDANNVDVLDWQQVQAKARALRDARAQNSAGLGPFTVADVLELYLAELAGQGRQIADTEPGHVP